MNAESKPCPPCPPESRQSVSDSSEPHSQGGAGAYDKHFRKAQELVRRGDGAEAAKEFCKAASCDLKRWAEFARELSKKNPTLAIACLSEVLNLEAPRTVHAGAWCNIGRIYADQGKLDDAEDAFRKSWSIHKLPECADNFAAIGKPIPDQPPPSPFEQHYRKAIALLEAGEVEKSARKFLQAGIADPEKFCTAAIETARIGDPRIALAVLSELLNISKSDQIKSATWCAIGNVYSNEGKRPEAMESFVKSWDLNAHPGSASNRALIHLWNGEVDEAEYWIKRSLDLLPWLPSAQFVQSMVSMVGRGQYLSGFKQYESRWRGEVTGDMPLRKLPSNKPEWPGPQCSSGRLLVYGEQGMGDTILALRYARLIRELGLKQIWVIQPPVRALAESMGIIDEVKSPGDEFHDYDFHIPAMSLPRCFQTTIENIPPAPYIHFQTKGDANFEPNVFRVGICWSGSSINRNNGIRSAPLRHWAPVLDVPGVEFHSFQVDGGIEALTCPKIRFSEPPKDWLETAKRVAGMDLVISVDTALVHLCGALGVPCWCALHCRPYFVYPLTHEHTPWYSSVRLFKQKTEHEWAPVFEKIADELRKLVG